MPNPSERKRLKDRITESVSRAVKQIQRLHSEAEEETVLSNDDWQFQRLVEHLDHALLHGLKNITSGYWVLVKEFTPKATVKEIDRLSLVTTNLGRGRAWLYLALADHLLESYLNCYISNQTRVRKFYMKEALVLDQDQMQVLLTVSMGLEHVSFQLEVDKPYLDLASHVRLRTKSVNEGEEDAADTGDKISLNSMSSQLSLSSCATAELAIDVASLADLETISNDSSESDIPNHKGLKISNSLPLLQGTTPPSRIDRISSIQPDMTPDLDLTKNADFQNVMGGLEVIRHKIKIPKAKRKGHNGKIRKTDTESLNSVDMEKTLTVHIGSHKDLKPSPLSPESGYKSVVENNSPPSKLENFEPMTGVSESKDVGVNGLSAESGGQSIGTTIQNVAEQLHAKVSYMDDSVTWSDDSGTASQMSVENSIVHDTASGFVVENSTHDDSLLDQTDSANEKDASDITNDSSQIIEKTNQNLDSGSSPPVTVEVENFTEQEMLESSQECVYDLDRSLDNSNWEETDSFIDNREHYSLSDRTVSIKSCKSPAGQKDESASTTPIKSITGQKDVSASTTPIKSITGQKDLSASTIPIKSQESQNTQPSESTSLTYHSSETNKYGKVKCTGNTEQTIAETLCPWDIKVDNNTKLLLMLEVFQSEEESFIKMFSTCLGHTEGDLQPVLLILTDRAIYLTSKSKHNKFRKEATINFTEIDYISLGLEYQVLNIVCTNRRKQFWITTGDALLTKCIMGHLDNAIRHSEQDLPRLSILTDATNQKIAIKKWAASECRCQKTDVTILHYSLVYWEDAEPTSAGWLQIGASKEGTLRYKSHDSYFGFGSSVWKTGYFILREGTLYLHREKHDKTPPLLSVNLNVEQCKGCRMCRDMANTMEVLLSDGSSLLLGASSLTECQEWLQSLCQAVSQQMGAVSNKGVIVPCCLVLTRTRLLTCHEDVQTSFFRTLGAANLIDITAVYVHPDSQHFCVIRFDAPNSHEPEQWVVYFNCAQGRDNFLSALDDSWRALFQVELPSTVLEDKALLKRCRDGLLKIRHQRAL